MKKIDDKEKTSGTFGIIGVMLGTVVGAMLSLATDNFIFLGVGSTMGLLFGSLLGTIATEGIVIKVGTAKKKKKSNKKK